VVASNSTTGVYTVTVAPAKTAGLAAGSYKWQSYATLAGNRYTVDTGVFTLVQNLSAVTGAAAQTHAEAVLVKIEAEIVARLAGDGSSHEHYTINNRQIQKIPILTLMRLRAIYQSKVYRLQNPGSLRPRCSVPDE